MYSFAKEVLWRYKNTLTGGRLVGFNFHQVAEKFEPRLHMAGTFTPFERFDKFIKFLKRSYTIISLEEAIDINQKRKIGSGRYAFITFDDGDKSIENIITYLSSMDIPSSYFINSSHLEPKNNNIFYSVNYLINSGHIKSEEIFFLEQKIKSLRNTTNTNVYLQVKNDLQDFIDSNLPSDVNFNTSYEYLSKLSDKNIILGLHGHEHDRFINLDKNSQIASIDEDIRKLSGLNAYRPIFAIPFGRNSDWNKDTVQICLERNIELLFADGGINKGGGVGLKRVPADRSSIILESKFGYFQ